MLDIINPAWYERYWLRKCLDHVVTAEAWPSLATSAWRCYRGHGRGVLLLDNRGGDLVLRYLTISRIETEDFGLDRRNAMQKVLTYDPMTAIVLGWHPHVEMLREALKKSMPGQLGALDHFPAVPSVVPLGIFSREPYPHTLTVEAIREAWRLASGRGDAL